MAFVEIGIIKVRIGFRPADEPGIFHVDQDCDRGCKCQSRVSKCTPSVESAASMILCFNDSTKQGITGKDCTGKAIQDGPDAWIYEVDAKLKAFRPDPPVAVKSVPEPPVEVKRKPRPIPEDCPF